MAGTLEKIMRMNAPSIPSGATGLRPGGGMGMARGQGSADPYQQAIEYALMQIRAGQTPHLGLRPNPMGAQNMGSGAPAPFVIPPMALGAGRG